VLANINNTRRIPVVANFIYIAVSVKNNMKYVVLFSLHTHPITRAQTRSGCIPSAYCKPLQVLRANDRHFPNIHISTFDPSTIIQRYTSCGLPNFVRSVFSIISAFLIPKLNSVALVRTRTIPTDRPPPVGEVSANFWG